MSRPYEAEDIGKTESYAHPEKFDELFIRLRKENPVPWVESSYFRSFWALTKFADIVEIHSKPQIFSNEQPLLQPKAWEEARIKKYGRASFVHSLFQMNPPEHTAYRGLLQEWFTPQNVLKQKSVCEEITSEFITKMISQNGECDFVSTISRRYPMRVIMRSLGLPREDEELVLKLTGGIFSATDPDFFKAEDAVDIQVLNQQEFMDYFKKIVEEKKAHPQNDLSSLLANAKIGDKPIPEFELLSILTSLASAGHETTGGFLAGILLVFAQRPDIFKQLKSNLSLIPIAMEEFLRWVCPAKLTTKTALSDYEIRGKKIKKGDFIALCYQSACRDEESIPDPFTLQINRTPNRHIAFGSGVHTCLGQYMARLEVKTFLEQLLPRLESIELAGEFSYVQAPQVSTLKKLPIKYNMK